MPGHQVIVILEVLEAAGLASVKGQSQGTVGGDICEAASSADEVGALAGTEGCRTKEIHRIGQCPIHGGIIGIPITVKIKSKGRLGLTCPKDF